MDDWTIGALKGESDRSGGRQHRIADRTDRHRHSTPACDEPVTNVLSFDLEHWHSATLINEHVTSPDDRIEESVRRILEILDAHNVTATFFTAGAIAREYPELVSRIADKGHEVASHGDTHTPLSDLDRRAFKAELKRSSDAIERVTGTSPEGFRAPNFSLEPTTAWAAQALAAAGFAYDASIFPVRTPMYGVSSAPARPYRFHPERPFTICDGRPETSASLVELPAAVFHPWFRLPIAGGFYGRMLPRELLAAGIRNLNRRGAPAILYFHPWEFNPDVATTGLPWHKRFVSFHGIDKLGEKLGTILDSFAFDTAEAAVATVETDGFRETDSHDERIQT